MLHRSVSPSYDTRFVDTLRSAEISEDLITIIASIRRFSHAISEANRTGIRLSPYAFEEDIILLLHDLLTYQPADCNDDLIRVSALIYLEGVSHGLPLATDFSTQALLHRFAHALQHASPDFPLSLRLWALGIALLSSRGLNSSIRDWLLNQLRVFAQHVQDADQWKEYMRSALWIDVMHSTHIDALHWELFQ